MPDFYCLQKLAKSGTYASMTESPRRAPPLAGSGVEAVAKGRRKLTELGEYIRDQRNSARLSVRKLSDLAGISNPYLSQIERGLRKPSAEILQAIAKGLRISAETLYVRAGILEDDPNADLVTEILRDPFITERQKQVLVDIYKSFREGDRTRPHERAASIKDVDDQD